MHKPAFDTYRLSGRVLVPPGAAGPEVARRTLVSDLAPGKGDCAREAPLLQRRKKRLTITVDRESLLQPKPPGWLAAWSVQAEADGCLAQGEGVRTAELIAALVPLDSLAAWRLLHVSDVQAGYVELGPENRLEVRSPLGGGDLQTAAVTGNGGSLNVDLRPSSQPAGFEIGWFALRPNTGRIGSHFEPLYADRFTSGGAEHLTAPAVNYFQFPPQAAFYRLLYKTDDTGIVSIVVAGTTRAELDSRTRTGCEKPDGFCLVLPRRVGVNPFLTVTVSEKEIPVRLDGTIRSAIQAAGARPESVLATLAVTRLYGGRLRPVEFAPGHPEILDLKLNGGEHLSW